MTLTLSPHHGVPPGGAGDVGDPIVFPFVGAACPEEMRSFDRWDMPRFLRLQKIGSGFASTVYLAVDTLTSIRIALKVNG